MVKGRDVKSYGGRKMRDEKGDPLQDPQWGQIRSKVFPAFPGFPAGLGITSEVPHVYVMEKCLEGNYH